MCESGAVVTELVTLNPLHLERMKLLKSDGEARQACQVRAHVCGDSQTRCLQMWLSVYTDENSV